jgi:putative glutathione S-transferase
VPALWDKHTGTLVNNESADILRMLNSAFAAIVDEGPDLYPEELAGDIDRLNDYLYTALNNGVYQAGFAALMKWIPVCEWTHLPVW